MKRVKAACIIQTLHFQLKEDVGESYARSLVQQEVKTYKEKLVKNRTMYKILQCLAVPLTQKHSCTQRNISFGLRWAFLFISFLQAMGKAASSTMLSMVREIVFGVGFALILPIFLGLDGVLYSMPVSDVLTAIISAIIIYGTYKELDGHYNEEI